MWARVVETMLACWLAISPLVFHRDQAEPNLWWIDLSAAAAVATLALLSYWTPTRHAHFGLILIGVALIATGLFAQAPPAPSEQNHVVVGLLLLLFAIIPNNAFQPPRPWREFNEQP